MTSFEVGREDIDFDTLANYLKALSNPGRLEILWHLRSPGNPGALLIRPRRQDEFSPERAMSRQTVSVHLEKLEEAGVVSRVPQDEGEERWVTNVPQLFALAEEFRKLTAIPAAAVLNHERTTQAEREDARDWPEGPKLVLTAGPWEGRAFPLKEAGPWTLGRSRSRTVALTYDPFASLEHATIAREDGRFAITSATSARNPVAVNFLPLQPGLPRALRHGDLVSVGRSPLLFHER